LRSKELKLYGVLCKWSSYENFYSAWCWLVVKADTCCIMYTESQRSVVVTDCMPFIYLFIYFKKVCDMYCIFWSFE